MSFCHLGANKNQLFSLVSKNNGRDANFLRESLPHYFIVFLLLLGPHQ